ncbi:MAG: hypothetical protein QOG80_2165, partial [Pseudonocardiales bacterium]|nr:hypothetical protein [Pseudonocardiales bacterium]
QRGGDGIEVGGLTGLGGAEGADHGDVGEHDVMTPVDTSRFH